MRVVTFSELEFALLLAACVAVCGWLRIANGETDAGIAPTPYVAGDTPPPGPTDPVPTPEPAPKLLTFEQVMGYQLRWQQKQEEYLTQGGWRMDEANPGQFFLWHIEHKGVRYALGREDAIYVQARIEKDAAQAALERQIEQSTGVQ